jgi:hypothetical protein
MKLGEQVDVRPVRRRAIRRAWKSRGEVIPDGRYHGWVS